MLFNATTIIEVNTACYDRGFVPIRNQGNAVLSYSLAKERGKDVRFLRLHVLETEKVDAVCSFVVEITNRLGGRIGFHKVDSLEEAMKIIDIVISVW